MLTIKSDGENNTEQMFMRLMFTCFAVDMHLVWYIFETEQVVFIWLKFIIVISEYLLNAPPEEL